MWVSSAFFSFGVYLFLLLFIFIIFLFQCLIAFFNNKYSSFFASRYVPLVIKAKRIAVDLLQCSLAEDDTMLVLLYFCT